jgi:hypothetical protein
MSNTETIGRKPSHEVFAVEGSAGKSFRTKIGTAWLHEDGKGFTIKLPLLPLLPLAGHAIHMRLIEPKVMQAE